MTVIRPNSISGITSITAQANEINVFRSDGTLAGLQLNGVNFNTTTGISTLAALNVTGNVSVGGTLTYQDVTNIDSVGIITARSGIDCNGTLEVSSTSNFDGAVQIADTILHLGDTNTKIRFPAADTITAETGGTERLRITSGGETKFTVGTNKTVKFYAASHNDETNLGAGLGFSRQSDGAELLSGIFGHSNTGLGVAARDHITFLTGGSSNVSDTEERLRITSDGKIGINNASPTFAAGGGVHLKGSGTDFTSYRVTASSNTGVDFSQASDGKGYVYNRDNADLIVGTNNTERLRIASNSQLLHTRTDNVQRYDLEFRNTGGIGDGNYGGIHWTQGASGATNLAAIEIAYANSGRPDIVFKNRQSGGTSISEALRINSSGKVSIASGAYGGGGTVPELYVKGTSGRQMKIHNSNAGTSSLQITNGTTGEGEDAGTQLFTQGSTGDFYISNQYASGDISFNTRPSGGSNTNRLTIQSDGHIISGSNNTQNFGSSSNIWAGIFANYARFSANLAVGSSSLQNANVASFKGNNYNQVNITHGSNSNWGMLLTNSNSNYYNSGYHQTTNSSASSPIAIVNVNNDCLYLGTNNTARWRVEHDGHFIPLSTVDIGSTGRRIGTLYASNSTNTSDRNEKNTITESDLGLDFICKLKPVSYKWNQKEGGGLDTKTHYGLISQDVEEVIIETGKTLDDFGAVDKPDGDPMGLSYNEFISPLVKAIQEQQEQIKILQEKIAALEGS